MTDSLPLDDDGLILVEQGEWHARPRVRHRRKALPAILVVCFLLCFLSLGGIYAAMVNQSHSADTALLTYRGHSDFISAIAWSPNGKYIASGSWDHTVQVWDAQNGATLLN